MGSEERLKTIEEIAVAAESAYQEFVNKIAELEIESKKAMEEGMHEIDVQKIEAIRRRLKLPT